MEGLEWGLKFQELIDSSVTNIGQTAVQLFIQSVIKSGGDYKGWDGHGIYFS